MAALSAAADAAERP